MTVAPVIRLLGPLEVSCDGAPLTLGGPTERGVLALLALHAGSAVSVDSLVDGLWGEDPPPTALKTVRSYVSRLRSRLEPVTGCAIEPAPSGYVLRLAGATDLAVAERSITDARAAFEAGHLERSATLLERALALWRGDVLDGLAHLPFAQPAIVRLDELRAAALEDHAEALLALGRHTAVVQDLSAACLVHPFRERMWAQLMLALFRSGRQADALRTYQQLRTALVDELGVEPSPKTRALEQAILLQDPTLAWAPGPQLPSGLVTFVMTDIEGSTQLFRALGDAFRPVLADHNRIIRDAFERAGGVIVKTEGDAFLAAFGDAASALAACVEAQLGLARQEWPGDQPVRVRIGLHTGEAEPVDGDYVSLEVHQVARVCSAAHGGQTLVSEATAHAVGRPPAGAALSDVGAYQLRGFDEPARLYQVDHEELAGAFPPVRAPAALAHSIPILRTTFVGREEERSEIAGLLRATGIATIVGPGGVGKTRLALQIALDTRTEHPDGVWFVELGTIADGARVPHLVAAALGVSEQPVVDIEQPLLDALAGKQALLVLDNCEHLIDDVASFVERLTQSLPQVRVLATSREPLDIDGEAVWQLGVLRVPDPERLPSLEQLASVEAVRLFVDRAALVQPRFTLDEANAREVASIVAQLDGIPLAIELAAAALRDLAVEDVEHGLDDRFALLTRGRRNAPTRHQTLWATLEWGYLLLDEPERAMLRRLSVFAPGWTVAVAAQVASGGLISGEDVPALVDRLRQASLVAVDPHTDGHHHLLETVREFARAKLQDDEDADLYVARHVGTYLSIAEEAEADFGRAGRHGVSRELAAAHDNLRQAISACTALGESGRGLRLATALAPFWSSHGDWTEGIDRLTRLLDEERGSDAPVRARALNALANLLLLRGDLPEADRRFAEALSLTKEQGPPAVRARSISGLGFVAFRMSRLDEAERLWTEALADARASGDDRVAAGVLRSLAIAAGSRLDQARTGKLLDEAIALARSVDDDQLLRLLLSSAGELHLVTGEYERSREQYDQAVALADALGDLAARPALLTDLGWLAYLQGDHATADRLATEAGVLAAEAGNRRLIAAAARLRGEAAGLRGDPASAAGHLDGARAAAEELGAPAELGAVLCAQACRSVDLSDPAGARRLVDEVLALRPLPHGMRRATPHWVLGEAARLEDDPAAARHHFGEELAMGRQARAPRHQAHALRGLGDVSWALGDVGGALGHHGESLRIRLRLNDRVGVADSLEAIAEVAAATEPATAALLLGAASASRSDLGAPLQPRQRPAVAQAMDVIAAAGARAATGEPLDLDLDLDLDRAEAVRRALELTAAPAAG